MSHEAPKLHYAIVRIGEQMARGEITEEVSCPSSLRLAARKRHGVLAEKIFAQNWLHFWLQSNGRQVIHSANTLILLGDSTRGTQKDQPNVL